MRSSLISPNKAENRVTIKGRWGSTSSPRRTRAGVTPTAAPASRRCRPPQPAPAHANGTERHGQHKEEGNEPIGGSLATEQRTANAATGALRSEAG